jgi:hypothetical protein
MAPTTTRAGALLRARKEKRQQNIDQAVARAKLLGLSLTCAEKPVEWHGTCRGLDGAAVGVDLGCLCECHDVKALG